ncbi:restriction endonuclease subunit S (plasmid) [Staphylococcus xylosus]|uniref:restriction endonuclease subunit S n=1 Tax=Staphylococcus xylosus TaxID=1288 RepID=UPI0037484DF3
MTNDVKNIPELRFPEFSSEWIEKRLGDIGEFKNGLNKDKTEFGFGVPFVNLNDVFSNIPIVKENLSLVNANDKEIKDYNLVQGDTLFIRSSVKPSGVGLTKVIINNDFINTVYSGFLIRYRNFEKYNIDNNFKKYIFNSKSVRKQVIRQSTSSANTNINQEELKLIKINMPPTVEQQKIGEFFSKLDRQIELEEQKLSLLEEQKKGYMQKIFSQKIRFKDENGNNYPVWQENKLENIALKVKTKNFNNEYKETFTNSAEFGIVSQRDFFDKDISNEKNLTNYYIVEENDFVYNPRISNYAPVGPINRNKLGRTGIMSPLYTVFKVENINKLFLEYYFKTSQWHKFMKLNGDSGARSDRFTIKINIFMQMPIMMPAFEEQEKIGDFFSKIDNFIEKQSDKVELLKERKKGFLQKMFV